jgi:hypothetical protein
MNFRYGLMVGGSVAVAAVCVSVVAMVVSAISATGSQFFWNAILAALAWVSFSPLLYVALIGMAMSALVVRPLLQRTTTLVRARLLAIGILVASATAVTVAYVLVALGGNFIASGAVNFAFVPLIAIPSAVALVAYALASAGVSFLAVRNSHSPQNAGTQEI